MKIIYSSLGKARSFDSVQSAVGDALQPSAYSYDTEKEKLKLQVENLQEMLARLIENIYGDSQYRYNKSEQLQDILGYGYEVEDA